jgi:hypothetical protein
MSVTINPVSGCIGAVWVQPYLCRQNRPYIFSLHVNVAFYQHWIHKNYMILLVKYR